jgi:CheY-like chemotaxis protein
MAKILIIDDERTILELFKYIFEDAGHKVELASNGLQALEMLQTDIPDLIVLDVSMPEMSGKEFIIELGRRAARNPRFNNIPFVVMTGENFMEAELNKVFASARGFVCFFPKMTPPERVLEKAAKILGCRL